MKTVAIACFVLVSVPAFAEDTKIKTDVTAHVQKTDSVNELKVERKKVVDRPGPGDTTEITSSTVGVEKDGSGNTTLKSELKKDVDNPGVAHDHHTVKKTKVVKDSHGKVIDVQKTADGH